MAGGALYDRLPGPGARLPASGDAPPDGDFARLLVAASQPSAHRMSVDPTLAAMVTPDTRIYGTSRRPVWASPARPPERTDAAAPTAPQGGAGSDAWGRAGAVGRAPDAGQAPGAGATALRGRWAERPLRDRVVQVLFALAAVWIVGGLVSAMLESPGDALGGLLVLGAAAFIALRAWAHRSPRTPPRA
jgi:hypothetical protein